MTTSFSQARTLLKAFTLASLALAGAFSFPASGAQAAPTSAISQWSREVWNSARAGESDKLLNLLESRPLDVEAAEWGPLATTVDGYISNSTKQDDWREQRITEVQADLEKHFESGELLKGLKDAIEWHTLAHDKQEVLSNGNVRAMVEKAVADAKAAEEAGSWLDAHALYNHLNVLFDDQRIYESDLRRLGQRLLMLRLYTPERLHEMRSAQRVAEGEDALPPFNKIGENWREKLAGIDDMMLTRSLGAAAAQHVDRVTWDKLLLGGYQALRTMVTTPDLAAAFPSIAEAEARDALLAVIDSRIAEVLEQPQKVDYGTMMSGIRQLLEVNGRTTRIAREALIHEFTNGAFAELDEFSAVIWPDELAQFERTTEGTFKGVGIQITLSKALDIQVVTPLEGTPAARAGIRAGDLIRRVDGDSTLGMSLTQAVERITGPAGSKVTLTIEREGAQDPIDFELTRTEIPIYSVKGWLRTGAKETEWDWFIDKPNQIGYVRISQFTNKTTQEMRAALNAMQAQGLKGLILDLRGNPGGLLSEAVGIASIFIQDGPIVTQEDNKGKERERQNAVKSPRIGDIPVTVLINGGSASASEIVAGALQDYRKAVIVGDRSFGKGSVQNVFMLGASAAFKLTTQYYRLPGQPNEPGRLIHRRPDSKVWGVEPDVRVEVLPKQFGDAFELRQKADIIDFDENGNLKLKEDHPDPARLITEGLDPQLAMALLLVQSQVLPSVLGQQAAAN